MKSMLDILIDIFPEFGLPEPETDFTFVGDADELVFLFAWPNHKIGIRQGNNDIQLLEGWLVLECYNLENSEIGITKSWRAIECRIQCTEN